MRTPVSVAVAGVGDRGARLARAFERLESAELRWVFDQRPPAALRLGRQLARAEVASTFEDLIADDELDAIAIATPASSRFTLARRAIEAGKHVLIESPVALHPHEAEWLASRANADHTQVMVGGACASHPAARRLKRLVSTGQLGEVYYLSVDRSGLAERRDEGVLWHAGAEAVALVLWLLGDEPIEAAAQGTAYGTAGPEDVVFGHLRFATGILADLRFSALEPRDARRLTVVASGGMGVFDELSGERPLTVHERGGPAGEGNIVSPVLPAVDVAQARCERFITAVRSPATGQQDALGDGPAVVAVLRALQCSLERGGHGVPVSVPAVRSEGGGEPAGAAATVVALPVRSRSGSTA